MAFNTESNTNPATQTRGNNNDSWKATGFLNLWVPTGDGGRRKLGSIPLRDSKTYEAALIKRLSEDGAIEALLSVLEVDFQLADKPVTGVGF